jgi:hypothetical protein
MLIDQIHVYLRYIACKWKYNITCTVLPLSVLPFVARYFPSHFSQQLLMAEIWYLVRSFIYMKLLTKYQISWEAFLNLSHSYFLLADLVGFYAHWTYMQGYHKWALAHSSSCFNYDVTYASLLYVVKWIFAFLCQLITTSQELKSFSHRTLCIQKIASKYNDQHHHRQRTW